MYDVYVNTSVSDICNDLDANTSVAVTRNGFFEVSQTDRKVTLVVFDCELSKKFILIGDSKTTMDLPNGTSIYHLKQTSLLDGFENSIFSTELSHDFLLL